MAVSNTVQIRIQGQDQSASAINKARQNLSGLEKSSRTAGLSVAGLAKGFGALAVAQKAIQGASAVAGFQANIEKTEVAFQTLLGNATLARKRIQELTDFSARTPFQLEGVADANRLLQSLTGGALATSEGMRLVGDAAAAAGRDLGETSMWIGRLYAGLESGTPIGEATLRLVEMGLISGETQRSLNAMVKDGALPAAEAMKVIEETFGNTSGAMELQSQTMLGLISTLKDFTLIALSKMPAVEGAFIAAKGALEGLLRAAGALEETDYRTPFREVRNEIIDAAASGKLFQARAMAMADQLKKFYDQQNLAGIEGIRKSLHALIAPTVEVQEKTKLSTEELKARNVTMKQAADLADKMALDMMSNKERELELARREMDTVANLNALLRSQESISAEEHRNRMTRAREWLDMQYALIEAKYADKGEGSQQSPMDPFADDGAALDAVNRAMELQTEYRQFFMDDMELAREAEDARHEEKLAQLQEWLEMNIEVGDLIAAENAKHAAVLRQQEEEKKKRDQMLMDYRVAKTGEMFGNLSQISGQFFGKESAAFKAFAIGEAMINTYRAANQVLADEKLPTFLKWAAMATTIGMGIANVASISGVGRAHSGATNIPSEGTYLLNKGERVLAPEQNRDLTDALERGGMGGGSTQIMIDGEVLARTINQMASDGRLTIPARAVA